MEFTIIKGGKTTPFPIQMPRNTFHFSATAQELMKHYELTLQEAEDVQVMYQRGRFSTLDSGDVLVFTLHDGLLYMMEEDVFAIFGSEIPA